MLCGNMRALMRQRKTSVKRGRVTSEQRETWAEAIRAPMRVHAKQWAFVRSRAALKAVCGNRRAGKTEGVGREVTAELIEREDLVVWVFSDTLKAFDRNWISRGRRADGKTGSSDGKVGMMRLLDDLDVPYKPGRSSDGAVSSITFPWGSRLQVLPAADHGKLEDARGGLFDLLWLDEPQKMPHVTEILNAIAGPASMDFDAPIVLTGTPGEEVGSFFHAVVSGDVPGWEIHDMTSADNPRFGDSWPERWARVVERGPRKHRGSLGLTDEQLDRLAALTEAEFNPAALSSLAWVRDLPAQVQREYLRLWVADAASLIYPSAHIEDSVRHWADWAPYPTAAAFGQGLIAEDLKRQVTGWSTRFDLLPKQLSAGGQLIARQWRALVGVDLGSRPDPFAISVQLFGDGTLYEFDTGKAYELRDDEQQSVVEHWLTALRSMDNVSLWGVVVDADGGNTPAQIAGWRHRLAPLLPVTGIMGAYKPNRDMQIRLLNMERSAGRVRTLRNGPIHLEEDHLQREPWDPEKPARKREEHKHRVVQVQIRDDLGRPTRIEVMPGNDAIDARRYPWYWATHIQEPQVQHPTEAAPVTWETELEARVKRARARRR